MNPAAANRLTALVDQYPLYSGSGEALYEAGDAYSKMGPRFRKQAGEEFARVVRDYPLSARADDAKKRLGDMELPVPAVNQDAYNREKYDLENYKKPGLMTRSTAWLHGGPDMSHAAKSGPPTMTDPKPTIPVSVPVVNTVQASNGAGTGLGSDVTATPLKDSGALDKQPDARSGEGTAQAASKDQPQQGPLPTNRDKDLKKLREEQAKKQAKLDKKNKKKEQQNGTSTQQQNQSNATQGAQTPAGTPAATSTQPTAKQPSSGQNPPNQ
jgi:outer membrane protein assembly factor BamD